MTGPTRRRSGSGWAPVASPTRTGWTLVRLSQHGGRLPDQVLMPAPIGGVLRAWVNEMVTERFASKSRNLVCTGSSSGRRLEVRVSLAVTGRLCAAAELTELACMPGASCPRCEGPTAEYVLPEPGQRQVMVAHCPQCKWQTHPSNTPVYQARPVVSAR